MDLIILILVLAVLGFILWIITTKIPMDPTIRIILQVVAAIAILLYLLRRFGGLPNVL